MSYIAALQAHPVAFLAPTLTSLTVQAFQTGLLFDLSVQFWARADQEHKLIRTMVAFVSVVAIYQTTATFASLWRLDVAHFGDWNEQLVLTNPDRLQSAVTAALASPIQAFLIRRCWILTNKNSPLLVFLSSLLLSTIGLSVYLCIAMFTLSLARGRTSTLPLNAPYIWSLILSAVLDLTLTVVLFVFLWRSRFDAFSPRVRRTIRRVVLISWEAAALPAVCAVLAVLMYTTMGTHNNWTLFFHAILGKFYAISLLVTLNARADLRRSNRVQVLQPAPRAEAHLPVSIRDEGLHISISSPAHHDASGDSSTPKDSYP
ncbi:hypothetical protein JAAARDRAFT_204385 [Jaapia argillacea MUCL 33604]|uniref:DUF6534 domain-containing protein n=1 Tax=Jaapia argillacea MUCL 33604 TaxID=933084 RepID=A0A067Q4W9_9AGAM|nr:hypothetical protein JAAARDRAFT_204385 [Jaapia argillacea MUCL 33604]